jgi:hypothetical protein
MPAVKRFVWTSLHDADAWIAGIGIVSVMGLASGVLG